MVLESTIDSGHGCSPTGRNRLLRRWARSSYLPADGAPMVITTSRTTGVSTRFPVFFADGTQLWPSPRASNPHTTNAMRLTSHPCIFLGCSRGLLSGYSSPGTAHLPGWAKVGVGDGPALDIHILDRPDCDSGVPSTVLGGGASA